MESSTPSRDTAWAMSQENVELARRGYEAFARGDVDAVLSALDSTIEVRPDPEAMGKEAFHGRAGFLKYLKRWLEPWDEYRVIPEKFLDVGDYVVVIYKAVGRGKDSGIEVESLWAHLWTVRNGKAVRLEIFSKPDEALEAAGLAE